MLTASVLHYAASHEDAGPASQRLHAAIVRLTGRPANSQQVADLVVTCVHRIEFDVARIWHGAATAPDWWEVRFGNAAAAVNARQDLCNFSGSEASALAFVSYELRVAGFQEHACSASGGAWIFTSGDSTLCRIERPHLAAVDTAQEARVTKALEGLRAYGDEERLVSRLRSLPGLENVQHLGRPSIHAQGTGSTVVHTPGGMAKCLRLNLQDRLGLELSQGASQECLAAMHGFRDWNELVALASRADAVVRPVSVCAWAADGAATWANHYRNQMHAIWAFSAKLREVRGSAVAEVHGYSTGTNSVTLYAVRQERSSILDPVEELFACTAWQLVDPPDDELAMEFAQRTLSTGEKQHG